jgi:putative SOS response-associated peptidase YedK
VLRRFFNATRDDSGNQLLQPEIYPDRSTPIIRQAEGERIMEMRRWGMPTPPKFSPASSIDRGVTNIRNTSSAHWRAWRGGCDASTRALASGQKAPP